ncbi:MAG: hypothetical protein AAFO95_10745 [Cyanobacteria bacterium J06600_6]
MSDQNMDDLLAQLNTKFESGSGVNSKAQKSSHPSSPPLSATSKPSMEQMLAELRADLESGRGRPSSAPKQAENFNNPDKTSVVNAARERDRLNALIDTDYRRQAHKREQKWAEIKRQAEAKIAEQKRQAAAEQAAAQRRQQELIELQQREELRNKRRKEALREDAKKWLDKLHPNSEEGRWFTEFSYSYENKLQAAIDYLEAMRETGL